MTTNDVMTAAEAAALAGVEHGGLCHEDAARALRSVVALHEAVASRDRHAAWGMRQAFVLAVDATRRADAVALRGVLPDVWERLRDAPEPTWPDAPPEALQGAAAARDGGGTGEGGGDAPAGATGAATGSERDEAIAEAAGVCERMAQAHDRLAAAADSEGAERRQREAAGVLRCAADRIRALAGGP